MAPIIDRINARTSEPVQTRVHLARWVVGDETTGMFWVVCGDCAEKAETQYTQIDFYDETAEMHPNCDSCGVAFE